MIRCFCLSAKAMHLAARCVPLARCGLFVITRRCLFIPCNALCHCEAPLCGAVAISRKGILFIKPTQDTFVLAWRKKAQTSIRVSIIARDNAISKAQLSGTPRDTCTRGEKAHTSKRVSIIACNNVISKAQLSGTPRDTVYPWGKGANKQKSEHCRLRQCDFKSAVCAAGLALFPFFRHILFLLWRRDFA